MNILGEEENLLSPPGIELRILGRSACYLVIITTELARLHALYSLPDIVGCRISWLKFLNKTDEDLLFLIFLMRYPRLSDCPYKSVSCFFIEIKNFCGNSLSST